MSKSTFFVVVGLSGSTSRQCLVKKDVASDYVQLFRPFHVSQIFRNSAVRTVAAASPPSETAQRGCCSLPETLLLSDYAKPPVQHLPSERVGRRHRSYGRQVRRTSRLYQKTRRQSRGLWNGSQHRKEQDHNQKHTRHQCGY